MEFLESLDLSKNHIGDKGGAALGGNTKWSNLKMLSLELNKIGDTGASKIVMNSSWVNLEELCLAGNEISIEMAGELKPHTSWVKLKTMICNVESEEVQDLLENIRTWEQERDVVVPSSSVNDSDAVIVARSLRWTEIQFLDLGENEIGDIGAQAIGKYITGSKLKELRLLDNMIGDEGAIAISLIWFADRSSFWSFLQLLSCPIWVAPLSPILLLERTRISSVVGKRKHKIIASFQFRLYSDAAA